MTIHLCHQGRQLGEFSKEQLEAMLKAGVITDGTLAWTSGLGEWKALREVLGATVPPLVPPPLSASNITAVFPSGHPNYVEGNGSREFPFVIQTSNTLRSAQVQREILDGIYGQGTKESADRFYYESHRGIHGNSDLCEHRFIIKGENKSIWFDLYLVTRLASDPEWNLKKNEIVSKALENPETVRILDKMFQKIGLPAQPTVAASTSGSPPGHSSPAVDTLKIANIPPVLRRPVSKQIHPVLAYFIPIGRLNRAMWFACNLLNLCALGAIEYLAELFIDSKGVPPQWLLVSVGCLCIYLISVTAAKRLHDLNASAWLFFLVFIPLVPLFLLVLSGTKGPNKYGPEP